MSRSSRRLRHFLLTRKRGAVIRRVADQLGLLYFGAVDQQKDDHTIIRGLTASVTQQDRHFAVGGYDGYDIALVDRTDPKHAALQQWTIIQLSLRSSTPSLFLLPSHRDEHFLHLFEGIRLIASVEQSQSTTWIPEFQARYHVHSSPQQAPVALSLLSPALQQGIAARFWPHAIEIERNTLYIYITEHRLDEAVLKSGIASALWLAEAIDSREA